MTIYDYYQIIKNAHIGFVLITGVLFFLRGIWMLTDSPIRQQRWQKILPHINDTFLLLSAIALCIITKQYPISHDWLTVKVTALLVYIGLGTVALKRGKTRFIRIIAFFAALLTYGFMLSVARSHSPWGIFANLF